MKTPPPPHPDAKRIFSNAIDECPAEGLDDFLNEKCGDDEVLREQVKALLAAHQREDSLLDAHAHATVTLARPEPEAPGTQIGKYKILQQIGEGGFGIVYMAEQTQPVKRKVALKIVKPGMDSQDVVARFEAERQALALMDHPNIAKVFDAGTTDSGRPYFVMELVKGVTVTEYCDKNRLTTRERLDLFMILCQAVQHAHQKGVIHRDIKPSNIMVTLHDGKPVPKVIDFGVSKALSQQLTEKTLFTRYGQMIGTPQYMSPEQAEMSGLDIDTRSDVYSLGVVLYELLTGKTPIELQRLREAGFAEVQRMIREDEPARPSMRLSTMGENLSVVAKDRSVEPGKLAQLVRGELDWIVMKALEKDRGRRYETASSFAADVKRYLQDEPIEACPPSTLYRLKKLARRNRVMLTAGCAIAASLIIGLVAVSVMYVREGRLREEANLLAASNQANAEAARDATEQERAARLKAVTAQQFADQKAAELEESLYIQRIRLAYQNILDDKPVSAREELRSCPEAFRDWEWHYLMRCCYEDPFVEHELPSHARSIEFDRAGKSLFVASHQGSAEILDLRTKQTKVFAPATDLKLNTDDWTRRTAATSSDGMLIAEVDADDSISVWVTEPRKRLASLRGHTQGITCVAVSPDGQYVASASEDRTVRLWDLLKGKPLGTIECETQPIVVTFDPSGNRLAIGLVFSPTRIIDVETRNPLVTLDSPLGPISQVRFDHNGTRIALAGVAPGVHVYDTASGIKLLELDNPPTHALSFNPSGTRIIGVSGRGLKIWNADNGSEVLSLDAFDNEQIVDTAFGPDGHRLAVAVPSQEVARIYDARPWKPQIDAKPKIIEANSNYNRLVLSPEGSSMAFRSCKGGAVAIHDTKTNTTRTLPIHPYESWDFAFGPKGRLLYSTGDVGPDRDNRIVCLDLDSESPQEAVRFEIFHRFEEFSIAVSPDGQLLISSGQNRALHVYSANTGELIRELPDHQRMELFFSPDGKYLVTYRRSGSSLQVWDTQELADPHANPAGEVLLEGSAIRCLSFNTQGNRIVFVDGDEVVMLDFPSGKQLLRFRPYAEGARAVAFGPEGETLATGSADGVVRLWSIHPESPDVDPRLLMTLLCDGVVDEVRFTSDGRQLAAATKDGKQGKVRIWDLALLNSSFERERP